MLMMKNKVPVVFDWLVIIACSCFAFIPFFLNLESIEMFQVGVYVILVGDALAFILQLMSGNKG